MKTRIKEILELLLNILKQLKPYIIIVIVVVLVRSFLFTPVIVVGDSMVPTLKDKQILLLDKISYRFQKIERFDIVVIKVGKKEIIKRVIGLPGENIEYINNVLYVNGEAIHSDYEFATEDFTIEDIGKDLYHQVPENEYLVLGDNRVVSADSRIMGFIDRKDILGKTNLSIWPIKIVH